MGRTKRKDQERIIENHLRNYRTYKTGIKTMQMQLDYILPNATVNYELAEGSTGNFNISSSTEKYAIDRIESRKALMLYENIEQYRVITNSIDKALEVLTDDERKYIHYKYFERLEVPIIADKMSYSKNTLYNLRKDIFDQLLISLKGLLHF